MQAFFFKAAIALTAVQLSSAFFGFSRLQEQSAEQYLESVSIPYGRLIQLAEEGGDQVYFKHDASIPKSAPFVRLGFHGTLDANAKSIAESFLRPSNGGYGERIYITKDVRFAAYYALRGALASVQQKGYMEDRTGQHDRICHVFAPASLVEERNILKISKKDGAKYRDEKQFHGLQVPFDQDAIQILPFHRAENLVTLPPELSSKLVTFCEPMLTYMSHNSYRRHLVSLSVKVLYIPFWLSSIVKDFNRRTLLKNEPIIDLEKLGQLENKLTVFDGKNVKPEVERCPFCRLAKNPDESVLEDGKSLMVVKDKYSPLNKHFLVIPKDHSLKTVLDLNIQHIPILEEMMSKCTNFLKSLPSEEEENFIMGFHIPDFTSVSHLHMHCIDAPYDLTTIKYNEYKYPFIPADDLIQILQRGKKLNRFKMISITLTAIKAAKKGVPLYAA